MDQTNIKICLIVLIMFVTINLTNCSLKKVKKDVKKLKNADTEIIEQLQELDVNYGIVNQTIDHLQNQGATIATLIDELEMKDMELNLTMQEIQGF